MKIEVLGTGCPKCKKTEAHVRQALADLGVDAEVTKVENINDIMEYDVMMTPAVAVDGSVKISGKVPTVEQLKKLIG